MNLLMVHIHDRPQAALPYETEIQRYLTLASRWAICESRGFRSEAEFIAYVRGRRQRPNVVLCDMKAKALTSEQFAHWLEKRRGDGSGEIVLAVGPADGWSESTLAAADLSLSFGAMTMPHALARLVLAEQIYRATTILTGHPYHVGH